MPFEPNIRKSLRNSWSNMASIFWWFLLPFGALPYLLCNVYMITNVATQKQHHKNWVNYKQHLQIANLPYLQKLLGRTFYGYDCNPNPGKHLWKPPWPIWKPPESSLTYPTFLNPPSLSLKRSEVPAEVVLWPINLYLILSRNARESGDPCVHRHPTQT